MPMDLEKLLLSEVRSALRMLENGECGLDDQQREAAFRTLQYYKTGQTHFTECTARGCIAQMYYFEGDTKKRYAPFFDYEVAEREYEKVCDDIPDYNFWDFAVTMNLVYSNHRNLIKSWTRGNDTLTTRISELSVSFLNDQDTSHPGEKIWWYMNN